MSCLSYQTGEFEIFQNCNKECGIITASEDQQYFSLNCLFCSEKFLYFDAFIIHIQTDHAALQKGSFPLFGDINNDFATPDVNEEAGQALLESHLVTVKEERQDDVPFVENIITGMPTDHEIEDVSVSVKQENYTGLEMPASDASGASEAYYDNDEQAESSDSGDNNEHDAPDEDGEMDDDDDDLNDDDLLEEALLDNNRTNNNDVTMHIKDRRMIQFLIDSYKKNAFLWDQRHPKFRCRMKRAHFLSMIVNEFKRRFNITLARDAVTRKWDNLRTVYKRECNRMSKEQTNVSTLWYFKELHFLNYLYGGNQHVAESVVQETTYRRRFSSLWNEESTNKLLYLVSQYPCFWDKYNIDYRSKERRGEALQFIVSELQSLLQVSPIQISKRMSQLRFDYSKQKQERFICEQNNKTFIPNFTYYEQMQFMDHDILPFKCEFCGLIFQTTRESEDHLETHNVAHGYVCSVCHMSFSEVDQFYRHKRTHLVKELKYHCEMCAASFKEKAHFNEHMRRHTNDMRFPCNECGKRFGNSIDLKLHMRSHIEKKPFICDICSKPFSTSSLLVSHRLLHSEEQNFKCDYAQCCMTFNTRQHMMEHMKIHFSDEEHKCDVCGKLFKSVKNLQNHKQIHDAIKKYVCKICGSAFAQAAGLYLHKRRHNRHSSSMQRNQNYS